MKPEQANHTPKDSYSIGSGTSCDYIYCNGVHFLKTVGDSKRVTTKAREVCKQLNEHDALCAVAEAAGVLMDFIARSDKQWIGLNMNNPGQKCAYDLAQEGKIVMEKSLAQLNAKRTEAK